MGRGDGQGVGGGAGEHKDRQEPPKPHIDWQDRPEIPQSDREKHGGRFPGEERDK